MKRFFKVCIICGGIVSVSYLIYRKLINYITLDEESENVFESLKTNDKVSNNFMGIVGVSLVIVSILGIIITLRAFSNNNTRNKKKKSKKNNDFEDIYS